MLLLRMSICWFVFLLTGFCVALGQEGDSIIRVGVIGLDTSHSTAFTKLMNNSEAKWPLDTMQVVCAYPHGSADIESSVSRIPRYTEEIKAMGVDVVDSIDKLIKRVDAVLLETNDGRPHLEQVIPVLKAGKPVFVDKPMAASLEDVIAIFEAGAYFETPVFSSSSLRYVKPALAARGGELVGKVLGCETFSPATIEPTHPDLYWYGIHGVEQLYTVMGRGCDYVQRSSTASTDVVVGVWKDGRIGTFRGTRSGPHKYGGTVFGEKGQASSGGSEGYRMLVDEIAKGFLRKSTPIDPEETIEIYAFMSAADISKKKDGARVSIKAVTDEARKKAIEKLKAFDIEIESDNSLDKMKCVESEGAIKIFNGDQPILTYHTAVQKGPDRTDPMYHRSGYIHPLVTPAGKTVTGDFAGSHPHQHGLFMAWVKTKFDGRDVDFWNQQKKTGQVYHNRTFDLTTGTDGCGFSVELIHADITNADNPVPVLQDKWNLNAVEADDTCYVFDFVSQQTCTASEPLELLRHVYGGVGIRGNTSWEKRGAQRALANWNREKSNGEQSGLSLEPPGIDVMGHDFLTSEGKRRTDGNHTRARWACIYGPVDGDTAGIALLMHPDNFRSPQPVRLHPTMPYFSYSPVVAGDFKINPGDSYETKMRIVVFDGEPDSQLLERKWKRFAGR